jgi:hypothetical protein
MLAEPALLIEELGVKIYTGIKGVSLILDV